MKPRKTKWRATPTENHPIDVPAPATRLARPHRLRSHREAKVSRKERNISVDVAPEIKEKAVALARKSGMPLTDYVRALLHEAVETDVVYELLARRLIQAEKS